jgi:steroid delta-isomerase-like uncharacterized protein
MTLINNAAPSTEQNKAIVRHYVDEVANRRNLAAIDELIAADYLHHSYRGISLERRGPAFVRDDVAALSAIFAEVYWSIEDLIAEGDRVVYRWTAQGVHQGEYMGIAATGKAVTMTGITILRIEHGKIAERWGSADQLGLVRQLEM